jgi:primosomal protein N' (replication factor Y) (superfamily II helicase)
VIQTFIPQNEMIKNLTESNYKDFFKKTLEERKIFNYPPFSELATLRYKSFSKENALEFISDLKIKLDKFNN